MKIAIDNPGSVAQLKAWLADQDVPMESLAKKLVQDKAANTEGVVSELLSLRLELSKTSIKKYETIARCMCCDGRVHGMLQFYGANRTGRWAGRLLQVQNLPQNHLEDLDLAGSIVKAGDTEQLEMLFGSVPNTLSELIRTALIPRDGCRFIVADFSAIEARVLAWLAGEEWVLEEFRGAGKIYEATASRIAKLQDQAVGLAQRIRRLVNENARTQMPEEEFKPEYDRLAVRYEKLAEKIAAIQREKYDREYRAKRISLFMRMLAGQEECLEFDPALFTAFVEKVVVRGTKKDVRLAFVLRDGSEHKVDRMR